MAIFKKSQQQVFPKYSVNQSFRLNNMFVFKSIHCSHQHSCIRHAFQGCKARFLKGVLLNLMFKLMLKIAYDLNPQTEMKFFQKLQQVILRFDKQIILSGLFSASFAVVFKLLICYIKHNIFEGRKKKFTYIFSATVSSYILALVFFTKPYRKILLNFALALVFDCLFKLIVSPDRSLAPKNDFHTNYVAIKDPDTGQSIN